MVEFTHLLCCGLVCYWLFDVCCRLLGWFGWFTFAGFALDCVAARVSCGGVLAAVRFTLVVVVLVCLVVFGVLRVVAVGCVGWSACVSVSGWWLVC